MEPYRIKTIGEFHQFMQLSGPAHPLVSVVRFEDFNRECLAPFSRVMGFYSIAVKRNFNVKMKYGQKPYDFNEGILFCMSGAGVTRGNGPPTRKSASGLEPADPPRPPLAYATGQNH